MGYSAILSIMVGAQLVVCTWFSYKGGVLRDKEFMFFTVVMLLGQLAVGIETYNKNSWRGFTAQICFASLTVFAGVQRYRQMKRNKTTK
jgi:hypothetical protein